MLATPGQHLLHSLSLAEVPLADELDLDAHLSRSAFSRNCSQNGSAKRG
jgi:hypothetical protein